MHFMQCIFIWILKCYSWSICYLLFVVLYSTTAMPSHLPGSSFLAVRSSASFSKYTNYLSFVHVQTTSVFSRSMSSRVFSPNLPTCAVPLMYSFRILSECPFLLLLTKICCISFSSLCIHNLMLAYFCVAFVNCDQLHNPASYLDKHLPQTSSGIIVYYSHTLLRPLSCNNTPLLLTSCNDVHNGPSGSNDAV